MFGACAGFIASLFGTTALFLSLFAGFWCKNFKFTPIQAPVNVNIQDPDIHMSPWFQQTTYVNTGSVNGDFYVWSEKYCTGFWAPPEFDSYWKASKAFSIIAVVFGGLGTIALYFSCCFPEQFNTNIWRSLALKFAVTITLSQGLTLLIFKSTACTDNNIIRALEASMGGLNIYNNTCEWDTGSSINVSAIVFWFLTGLSMILTGPPTAGTEPSRRSEKPKNSAAAAASDTPEKEKDAEEPGATQEAVTANNNPDKDAEEAGATQEAVTE